MSTDYARQISFLKYKISKMKLSGARRAMQIA